MSDDERQAILRGGASPSMVPHIERAIDATLDEMAAVLRGAGWTVEPPSGCDHVDTGTEWQEIACCAQCGEPVDRVEPPVPPSTALRDRLRGREEPVRQASWRDGDWVERAVEGCPHLRTVLDAGGGWRCPDCGVTHGRIQDAPGLRGADDLGPKVPTEECAHEWTYETYGGPKCRLCRALKLEIDRR